MTKIFRSYYVWPKFPSISMSGNRCSLQCKHCNHTYLNDMQSCATPEKLLKLCKKIANNGSIGFLLSGGCNNNGEMLNLRKLLPTIKKVKKETNLIVKLHTGIVDKKLSEDIVAAGVDIASTEVVGSDETIKDVFGFHATTTSYKNTLQNLTDAGIPYMIPHICIGLNYGYVKGEFNALKMIMESCKPSVLVMIVFRPTKDTLLEKCKIPSIDGISRVITHAKEQFPTIDISLGCLRPRTKDREAIEYAALQSGVTRMEIPSKNTIKTAISMGFTIRTISACCALPEELERRAIVT